MIATVLIVATTGLAVVATGASMPDWICLTVTIAAVLSVGPLLWRRAETRDPFYRLMAIVVVDLVIIVAGTHHLR